MNWVTCWWEIYGLVVLRMPPNEALLPNKQHASHDSIHYIHNVLSVYLFHFTVIYSPLPPLYDSTLSACDKLFYPTYSMLC